MNHSVHMYLDKRATNELEAILTFYLKEKNFESYKYVISEIVEILEKRYGPGEIPSCVIRAKEKL